MMTTPQALSERKTIEIVALKPVKTTGNLKAFASIRLGGVVIHDCRIVQQPGQRARVVLAAWERGER